MASVSGVLDVVLEKVDVDWSGSAVGFFEGLNSVDLVSVDFVDLEELLIGGVVLDVRVDDEGAEIVVDLLVYIVLYDTENVKSRKNGVAQVDIVFE